MPELEVELSRIVARLATGDLKGATAAEIKTLLTLTDAGVKAAYENNSDTNVFSDGALSKLSGIESSADVTDAANVAAAGAIMDSDISVAEGILRKTGAGAYVGMKTNLTATTAPTADDDTGDGYVVGSIWIDVIADKVYQAVDVTLAAAVWIELGGGGLTLGTEQATTSGTTKTFTGIPAGVSVILIGLNDIGVDGTGDLMLRIGDSGGIETSGYESTSNSDASSSNSTSAFMVNEFGASDSLSGIMTLLRMNDNHLWVSAHAARSALTDAARGGGYKTLSGELTQVALTRNLGVFDEGSVNIAYI